MRKVSITDFETHQSSNGGCTCSARVRGKEIWFSADYPLSASADTFACAFWLPALSRKHILRIEEPVDGKLQENMRTIAQMADSWWGLKQSSVEAESTHRTRGTRTGMFFTGGVDSFYTLLTQQKNIDVLIYVHGFDIKLRDQDRFLRSRINLERVAAATGKELVFVSTNLRHSKTFRRLGWDITHGGALAAVAHLFASDLRRVYIAGSDVPAPWGSFPELDRLWSSSALEIESETENITRFDKVRAIQDWSIAQDSLKVCWENRSAQLNCGECEKCIRTQAMFSAIGAISKLTTFPSGNLAARIDTIPGIWDTIKSQWEEIYAETRDPDTAAAIARLLQRSRLIFKVRDRVNVLMRKLWRWVMY